MFSLQEYLVFVRLSKTTTAVMLLLKQKMETDPHNPVGDGSTTVITPPDLGPLDVIRTETVFSKLPVHNLSKKGRVNIQIIKTGANGQIELKWEVSYSDRYGQARQLAYKLDTIVIDQRIEEAGKPLPERIRVGSLHEICRDLGLTEGENKNTIKRAFFQNASAFITAKLKYRGNDGTEHAFEAGFTRYTVIFTGQKFSNGTKADAVYIELHPRYREVLNNAPIRPLDLGYKKQLPPAAQRFYEILSYKIFTAIKYNQPIARLPYSEYCTFSAQQRYFDYDHFKKQMYKIHRPHIASGYILAKVHHEEATDSDGQQDWIMCYVPGPKARAEYATFVGKKSRTIQSTLVEPVQIGAGDRVTASPTRRPRQRPLNLQPAAEATATSIIDYRHVAELAKRGVEETAARKLVAELPAGYDILTILEWADEQIARQPGKFTNPPGFYISLLQGRTTPPPTFQSSAARKAQDEAFLAQQQARQKQTERHQAEEEARDQEASRQLAQMEATEPDQFQALYRLAKEDYFSSPLMAKRKNDPAPWHERAIRSRMKKLLPEFRQQDINLPARQANRLFELVRPQPRPFDLQALLTTLRLPAPDPTATEPESN